MSKIVWDANGEHFYHYGVDHGVLYPQKADGTYDNGVAWNGLTRVNISPDGGEANDIWADNIKYASLRGAENTKGTIEAYHFPDEFYPCNGMAEAANGVYIAQQKRQAFGFCYRSQIGNDTGTDADDGYELHIIYNATVDPSDADYETINDNPDAQDMSWDFDTTPVPVTGKKPTAHLIINSLKADAAKLTALETKLFGGDNTEPTLPTPDAVIADLT